MGFPRREYWNGLPFPSPSDLPNAGFKPTSLALREDSLPLIHWEAHSHTFQTGALDPSRPEFSASLLQLTGQMTPADRHTPLGHFKAKSLKY